MAAMAASMAATMPKREVRTALERSSNSSRAQFELRVRTSVELEVKRDPGKRSLPYKKIELYPSVALGSYVRVTHRCPYKKIGVWVRHLLGSYARAKP